ncbi:MAG: DNA-3-methyladenine glycosylase I [Bacteroidota bacterium]
MAWENSYCQWVADKPNDLLHKQYHDKEYGFPIEEDNALFERLMLEVNQAGLSWSTILKKKENFHKAYDGFNIEVVANYSQGERERLLSDAGIIRNKLKVNAAIHNAQQILLIQQEVGSFKNWLDEHHPKEKMEWVKLFKKKFKFVGGEIVNEFLMSTGYLPGAHAVECPIYEKVLPHKPRWITHPH